MCAVTRNGRQRVSGFELKANPRINKSSLQTLEYTGFQGLYLQTLKYRSTEDHGSQTSQSYPAHSSRGWYFGLRAAPAQRPSAGGQALRGQADARKYHFFHQQQRQS